jgi:NAD(P)H-hydrate repair Nnr-like enzyme with NAD(P)H-hydrate epimerase domain
MIDPKEWPIPWCNGFDGRLSLAVFHPPNKAKQKDAVTDALLGVGIPGAFSVDESKAVGKAQRVRIHAAKALPLTHVF